MKNLSVNTVRIILLSLWTLVVTSIPSFGQEEQEQVKPRLRMNYYKYMSGDIALKVNAYYKKDNNKEFCTGAAIGIYSDEDFENEYSRIVVDENGFATLKLKFDELESFADSAGRYNFYALLEETDLYRRADDDISVLDANLEIDFIAEDSANYLEATLYCFDPDSGRMLPARKKALKSFVQRSLSLFPIGGDFNYTDGNGKIRFEFPSDLWGNENGELRVIVKLDEDDDYGTVEARSTNNWGSPYTKHVHNKKALLIGDSSKAPLILIIGVGGTIIIVWGFLLYILIHIFRIRKIGIQSQEL